MDWSNLPQFVQITGPVGVFLIVMGLVLRPAFAGLRDLLTSLVRALQELSAVLARLEISQEAAIDKLEPMHNDIRETRGDVREVKASIARMEARNIG